MSKSLIIAGAALIALATPAFAQDFGQPLEAPRQSSPKYGTGPVITPEVGHPPAWGGQPAPKRTKKQVATAKGGVVEAPQPTVKEQKQEPPVFAKGTGA